MKFCFAKSFGVRKLRLLNPVYRGSGFEVEKITWDGKKSWNESGNPGIFQACLGCEFEWQLHHYSDELVSRSIEDVCILYVFFYVFISIPKCYFSWSSSIGERPSKVSFWNHLIMYYTVGCEQIFVDIFDHCKITCLFSQTGINKTKPASGRFPLHTSPKKPMAFAPVKSSHLMTRKSLARPRSLTASKAPEKWCDWKIDPASYWVKR